MSTPAENNNPCLDCGACCASFRVSFYWSEAESAGLPEALTEQINPFFACMAGTNSEAPRCAALSGMVGKSVTCAVYTQRPPACREVQAGDDKCLKARAKHDLPALPALVYENPTEA